MLLTHDDVLGVRMDAASKFNPPDPKALQSG